MFWLELEATQNQGTSWWATRSLMPGCPRLVVWLEFLVTNIFLIWNVRWAIKLQSAQLKVVNHTEAKWPPRFFLGFQFLCRRENSVYQLFLRTRLQQILQQTYNYVCQEYNYQTCSLFTTWFVALLQVVSNVPQSSKYVSIVKEATNFLISVVNLELKQLTTSCAQTRKPPHTFVTRNSSQATRRGSIKAS